jgi:hypothetical protein
VGARIAIHPRGEHKERGARAFADRLIRAFTDKRPRGDLHLNPIASLALQVAAPLWGNARYIAASPLSIAITRDRASFPNVPLSPSHRSVASTIPAFIPSASSPRLGPLDRWSGVHVGRVRGGWVGWTGLHLVFNVYRNANCIKGSTDAPG